MGQHWSVIQLVAGLVYTWLRFLAMLMMLSWRLRQDALWMLMTLMAGLRYICPHLQGLSSVFVRY